MIRPLTAAAVLLGSALGPAFSQSLAPARGLPSSIGGGPARLTAGQGSDGCATPDPIAGAGPFAFDILRATTGTEGQTNAGCLFSGTPGIESDVWFTWTSPSTGVVTLSVCAGAAIDSKVAVYDGWACPTAEAIACNDDSCGLQSELTFAGVRGDRYTIQIGNFPGAAPGSGTFTLSYPPPAEACRFDDGSAYEPIGLGNLQGGEQAFLQLFGEPDHVSRVHSISVSFGCQSQPGAAPAVGSIATIRVFDDPNDDGIPDDAVILQSHDIVVGNVDTDTLIAAAFTPPVDVYGVYFAALTMVTPPFEFPLGFDRTNPSGGRTWFIAESNYLGGSGVLDYDDLTNNQYFGDIAQFNATGVWLLRADCESHRAITGFCAPGSEGVLPCPCGNPPAGPRGCDNHAAFSGGAMLLGSGKTSLSSDGLILSASGENPSSLTTFWTGTETTSPSGVFHGAGVRCVTGLDRLYTGLASAGAITRPGLGEPSVSERSAAVGAAITPGQTRYYFTLYRDEQAAAPCGDPASTVNLSSALVVRWTF